MAGNRRFPTDQKNLKFPEFLASFRRKKKKKNILPSSHLTQTRIFRETLRSRKGGGGKKKRQIVRVRESWHTFQH